MERITYGFYQSEFGEMVLGVSELGLCWLGFSCEAPKEEGYKGGAFDRMKAHMKNCEFVRDDGALKMMGDAVMEAWKKDDFRAIKLDLRGTDFQREVWAELLKIGKGNRVSYMQVAKDIGRPRAIRAVGSAVGANPVSLLVPCHRVVQSSGVLGHYGWGLALKERLLSVEAA